MKTSAALKKGMKKFYNNNPDFGEAGPHKAESKESLADEMIEHFRNWANAEIHFAEDNHISPLPTYEELIELYRELFIKGLEEMK